VPDIRPVMDDDARIESLYRAHASSVPAYARRRLASPARADDIVSDVFLVVWRRLDEVPGEPRPWRYGVARRALANRRRGEHRMTALRGRITSERPEGATGVP
jgi:DNA-directed RNA polymerase specialized sigma24 family protein